MRWIMSGRELPHGVGTWEYSPKTVSQARARDFLALPGEVRNTLSVEETDAFNEAFGVILPEVYKESMHINVNDQVLCVERGPFIRPNNPPDVTQYRIGLLVRTA
jgi:hypothetical protein